MDNIKEKIKEAGYTQKQFAEEILGIKRLALYRKIKGEVKFTKLEKEKIKEVLNIDLNYVEEIFTHQRNNRRL